MRLTFFALVTGIVAGWAGGGRIGALGRLPLRAWWLLVVAIPLYIVTGRREDISYAYILFVASLVGVLLFVLRNLRVLPALAFVGTGLALNIAVIVTNHGMPYSIDALHHSGVAERTPDRFFRETVQSHPQHAGDRLLALSDRVSLQPLRELLSVGDIVMAFGLGLAAYTAMLRYNDGPRGAHAHRRPMPPPHADRPPAVLSPAAMSPAAMSPASVAARRVAAGAAVLDLTLHDGELLAHDRSLALDPALRADAEDGLTLIRLLARTPDLAITDELFRARERVRILGASPAETPALGDLARQLAERRREYPGNFPPADDASLPGMARPFGPSHPVVDDRARRVDVGLFGEPVSDGRPDAPH